MPRAPKKPAADKPTPTPIDRGRENTAKPPASVPPLSLPQTETPLGMEDEIRRRAYELYEEDGRQEGRDREHWLRAEAEILGRRRDQKQTA